MRGYFDGDGSIFRAYRQRCQAGCPVISILAPKEFLEEFKKLLPYASKSKIYFQKNMHYLANSLGNGKIQTLYNFFYEDSIDFLLRKKEVFQSFL